MNRRIKFRAWNPRGECWIIWGSVELWWNENEHTLRIDEEDSDLIYEQYTGLKDKNGKEIYEGDIVNICGIACTNDSEMACIMDTNSVVLWDKRYARFDVKDKPESKDWDYRRRRYFLFTDKDRDNVEVIGNIHENPELLEKLDD